MPLDIQPGSTKKISRQSKSLKSAVMPQGEIEIELRTASGSELRIRVLMDTEIPLSYAFSPADIQICRTGC